MLFLIFSFFSVKSLKSILYLEHTHFGQAQVLSSSMGLSERSRMTSSKVTSLRGSAGLWGTPAQYTPRSSALFSAEWHRPPALVFPEGGTTSSWETVCVGVGVCDGEWGMVQVEEMQSQGRVCVHVYVQISITTLIILVEIKINVYTVLYNSS